MRSKWVFGSGNEGFHKWIRVYQKAQAARKGIQVNCKASEIPLIMETLSPQGLFLQIEGVESHEMGIALLESLQRWTRKKTKKF